MKDPIIGAIGTGDFSSYLISALRKGGYSGKIVLSPYNSQKAHRLSARCNCSIAADHSTLLHSSDWILLAVRPEQLVNTMQGLTLRSNQLLISAVSGASIEYLRRSIGGTAEVIRIMPSSYIEAVNGGLIPMYPECPDVEEVLSSAGNVLIMDKEEQLDLAMQAACLAGWIYPFIHSLEAWFCSKGLSPQHARTLVAANIAGVSTHSLASPTVSLEAIADGIATPGTYTRLGMDHLAQAKTHQPWLEALNLVYTRLNSHKRLQKTAQDDRQ